MKKENKKYYYIRWKCSNCDSGYPYEDELRVPFGETIKQFSKKTACPICGCRGTIYEYGGAFLKEKE